MITTSAVITDVLIGEFAIKHPVQYMGDFINCFQAKWYKNSILRGAILTVLLVFTTIIITLLIQSGLFYIFKYFKFPDFIKYIIIGIFASTGLASNCLKKSVLKVINAPSEKKRELLSHLVTRNTKVLDDKKVYSSLIETYSENLSDGFISPLFYLIFFGFPGIMVFKAISTLDSMIGYKNEKYINFGKAGAILDDITNYIPARITALLIYLLGKKKISPLKIISDAKQYSTSPNAGFPVSTAAHALGVQVGGVVYYDKIQINKAEIGTKSTENYEQACLNFVKIHSNIEKIIIFSIILLLILHISI